MPVPPTAPQSPILVVQTPRATNTHSPSYVYAPQYNLQGADAGQYAVSGFDVGQHAPQQTAMDGSPQPQDLPVQFGSDGIMIQQGSQRTVLLPDSMNQPGYARGDVVFLPDSRQQR